MRFFYPLTCLFLLGLTPALSQAQVPLEATPSKGLELPDRSVGMTTGGQSVEVNPAGLGYMSGVEAYYAFGWALEEFRRTVPEGHALFLAAGTPGFGLGFGAQWLFQPGIGGELVGDDYRKYTVSMALGGGESVSFGVNYNFFGSDTSRALDQMGAWDAGFQLRFSEHLALGGLVRDLNAPFLESETTGALPRRWTLAPAVRAWGGRVQVEQMVHYTEDRAVIDLEPRLSLEFFDGIRLFARSLIRIGTDQATTQRTGLQGLSAGAEFSLGEVGTESALNFQAQNGEDLSLVGNTHSLWITTDSKRSLLAAQERWVVVDLTRAFADLPVDGLFGTDAQSFLELLLGLERLGRDPTVSGIVLNIAGPSLGWADVWELREAMQVLESRGKSSVAVLQSADTKSIMLASVAQQVWMMPNIVYDPEGISATILNFKEALAGLGVKAEFLRIQSHKSLPETYVRQTPSPASLAQTDAYVAQLYDAVVQAIATGRDAPLKAVAAMVDEVPLLPDEAVRRGYVDRVIYGDEFEDVLHQALGREVTLTRSLAAPSTRDERWRAPPQVAILVVEGSIVQGSSGSTPFGGGSMAGSRTLIEAINTLRTDDEVKAVVLRVDSPGGSALASDQMFRELRRLAAVKPLVTSMGGVAASGGYYIAAAGQEIFATPLTLTGSIGIFTGKFSLSGLADTIGLSATQVTRGTGGDAFSIWKPFTPHQREALRREITYLYNLFLYQVSQTRPLSPQEIDALGRGRVWSGRDAARNKLVDVQGGVLDALARAKALAGLGEGEEVEVRVYPDQVSSLGLLSQVLGVTGLAERVEPTRELRQVAKVVGRVASAGAASVTRLLLFQSGEALMLPAAGLEGLD